MFDGDEDLAYHHLIHFVDHISKYEEVHEDVIMKWFHITFEGDVKVWFRNLPVGKIYSFAGFVQVFRKRWDPSFVRGSDPLALHLKEKTNEEESIKCHEESFEDLHRWKP